MKKNKLRIEDLKVQSFIIPLESKEVQNTVKGGFLTIGRRCKRKKRLKDLDLDF